MMDSDRFKELLLPMAERIYPMVARMLGNRENAEDAVQDIMLKLWNDRKKIGDHPNIPALVFRSARNHCIDLIRKNSKLPVSNTLDTTITRDSYVHDETEWKELQKVVNDLLTDLPENQAEVLALRDLDGLEFDEIAALTDLKVEHIRVLLSRARKTIATKLEKIYDYEYKIQRSIDH